MQSNPTLLPNKFDGQLDRLSCLISRFRVQATVVMPNKVYVEPVNFFVFETADKGIELIFCPQVDTLSAVDGKCSKSIAGEIVAAAFISISGAGEHLVAALPETIHVSLHDVPALEAIISPIVEEVRHPRCGGQAVLLRLTEVFVIRLLRYVVEQRGTSVGLLAGLAHPRLSVALVSIHDAPAKQWSLEELADVAGMSRTQFAVTFKEIIGVTPGAYISNWRLDIAKSELASGVSIRDVAKISGFSSTAAFSRAYSRRFGHAPKYARSPIEAPGRPVDLVEEGVSEEAFPSRAALR